MRPQRIVFRHPEHAFTRPNLISVFGFGDKRKRERGQCGAVRRKERIAAERYAVARPKPKPDSITQSIERHMCACPAMPL